MKHVDTVEAAQALASELNSTERRTPVIVVTTPAGRRASFIDVDDLYDRVGDLVPVYLMATGRASWAFAEQMPEQTQVYGGAGRAYPAGVEWVHEPRRAPLRLAFNAAEGTRSTEALANDALGMAAAAGLVGSTVATTAQVVTGKVLGVTAGRGIVDLGSGQFATVVPELTVPGVAAARLVAPGMEVTGTLDDVGRMDVRAAVRGPSELSCAVGDVVLARVDSVDAGSAQLALHPQLAVEVPREAVTSNPLDDLDSLMSAGEVLRARVESTTPWRLILRDLEDDEEALPAFALIDGGPPWVVEGISAVGPDEEAEHPESSPAPEVREAPATTPPGRAEPAASPPPRPTPAIFDHSRKARGATPAAARETTPAAAPEPDESAPRPAAPPAHLAVARLQADLADVTDQLRQTSGEVTDLRNELRLLLQERTRATNRVNHLEAELARAKQNLRVARRRPAGDPGEGARFADPEEQLRHDVYAAWAHRIPPEDKAGRPLPGYTLGPHFLPTVDSIQGIKRGKILDVVVEVLTGIANEQASREVHPLRASDGGDAPQRMRADGASAWRVSLQINTASARRLHYWHLTDGTIELARVVVHDDYRI